MKHPRRGWFALSVDTCASAVARTLKLWRSEEPIPDLDLDLIRLQASTTAVNPLGVLAKRWGVPFDYYSSTPEPNKPSGDLFLLKRLPSGKIIFVMGDVMSHGTRSSIISLFIQRILHEPDMAELAETADPLTIMTALEKRINAYAPQILLTHEDLVTTSITWATFDPKTKTLRASSSWGIVPPLLVKKDGRTLVLRGEDAIPPIMISRDTDSWNDIKFIRNTATPPSPIDIEEGDVLVLMTDGAGDGTSIATNKPLALELVLGQFRFPPVNGPEDAIKYLRESIKFVSDDVTILSARIGN